MGYGLRGCLTLALLLAVAPVSPALAQGAPMTAEALADRAAIEDLITDYYNHFGGGVRDRVGLYYAEDGEMILGGRTYKGIEAIQGAYAAIPSDAPQRRAFALNILISNLLIKVNGDTATARMVFTETATETEGEPPKIIVQGREFDHLVKRNGRWLISRREIIGPKGVPEGWQD